MEDPSFQALLTPAKLSETTERNMPSRMITLRPLLPVTLMFALASPASAGNVYQFRDSQGRVLFTNMVTSSKTPRDVAFRDYRTLEKVTFYKDSNIHRYQNWGSSEYDLLPSYSKNRNSFDPLIREAAARSGVDKALVKAVIHTESGFNPAALSKPGAQGLMQLMPATAARYQVSNPFDPKENIFAGTRHLRYLLDRYGNNLEKALAAYNAGERNVEKYNGIPPFTETQDYVRRVVSRYKHLYKDQV